MPRASILVRQVEGIQAKLDARTRRQREAIRQVSLTYADRVFARVQDLCPRDTHFMAEHTRLELTREGYNWSIGWRAEDFIGVLNVVNGRVIKSFYPVFVVHGTRFMAGRDPLTPALAAERDNMRRDFRRAARS